MGKLAKPIVILAVVLVALVLVSKLSEDRKLATESGGGFTDVLGSGFDTGNIDVVEGWLGSAPDTLVTLTRGTDGWVVSSAWSWPAKEAQVDRLIENLGKLSGERRSSDASVLADYQIDDESGFHLVGRKSGGAELFHVVVGKNASGGDFVRTEGSNDVYLTSVNLRSDFGLWGETPKPPDNKRWVDLVVNTCDREAVDEVVLSTPDGDIVLTREFETITPDPAEEAEAGADETSVDVGGDGTTVNRKVYEYTPDAKGAFDKAKADRVIGALASLRASDVADPADVDSYGFEGGRSAEITLSDGSVTKIIFGSNTEDDSKTYVMAEGGKPAMMYKGTVDNIFKSRDELSPDENSS